MTVGVALKGLVGPGGLSLMGTLDRVASAGFNWVQLDATLKGLRPRDLDRRARRDLAASLSRRGLRPAGLDLFIPGEHFTDPAHQDRALAATTAALELAADLGRVAVSLPAAAITGTPGDARSALISAADRFGAPLALYPGQDPGALSEKLREIDHPCVGLGVDPAALLATGHNPAQAVHHAHPRVTAARLSDTTTDASAGGAAMRYVVGAGRLDVQAYRVALDLSGVEPVVIDTAALPDPWSAVLSAKRAWKNAALRM